MLEYFKLSSSEAPLLHGCFNYMLLCWTIMASINNLFLLIVARLSLEYACVMSTYSYMVITS